MSKLYSKFLRCQCSLTFIKVINFTMDIKKFHDPEYEGISQSWNGSMPLSDSIWLMIIEYVKFEVVRLTL